MAIESKPMRGRVVLTAEDAAAFLRQIKSQRQASSTQIEACQRAIELAKEFAEKGYATIRLGTAK